jgi:hypothetical protein
LLVASEQPPLAEESPCESGHEHVGADFRGGQIRGRGVPLAAGADEAGGEIQGRIPAQHLARFQTQTSAHLAYTASYIDRVRAVTPEDVRRLTATLLPGGEMTIVAVGDRAAIEEQLAPYGVIEG